MTERILLPGEIRLTALPPLSLYIHMPWCVRKCPYCDFNSHAVRDGLPEDAYIDALIRDLELALPSVWGRPVNTVFFGGGTPSLFSPDAIDRLLTAVRARIKLQPEAEITLEANPGTVETERLAGFREAGVNRVSLGIQSFDPGHLQALGRVHGRDEALAAAEAARGIFDTFNLDLMFALPGQTLEQLEADLEQALAFAPPHLSYYHLTLEPNTLFHRYPPELPDEDTAADMQDLIERRLGAAGYDHYEVSAYARPGHRARHNLNYWQFGDYLGIGAGAHSKISFPDRIERAMRHKHPQDYLQKVAAGMPIQEQHRVQAKELPFEFFMNALRLADGVPESFFTERTGLPAHAATRATRPAFERGWLERDGERLRPTALGQRYLNDLLQLFLSD